jgi:hypothetical protein
MKGKQLTASVTDLRTWTPKHRRPSPPSPAPLFPGDPMSPPDPAWLAWRATASPRDIKAEMFLRAQYAELYARLGLTPSAARP